MSKDDSFCIIQQSERMDDNRSSMGKQERTVDCWLVRMCQRGNGGGLLLFPAMHSPIGTMTSSCESNLIERQTNKSSQLFWICRIKRASMKEKVDTIPGVKTDVSMVVDGRGGTEDRQPRCRWPFGRASDSILAVAFECIEKRC